MDILLVDSRQNDLIQTRKIIERFGWTCDICKTGIQALNKLKHFSYDIVMTEIYIPIIDGISLCALIKERNPSIKVVIATIETHYYKKIQAFHAKADEYIVKPISDDVVNKRISGLIQKSEPVNNLPKRLKVADLVLNLSSKEVFRFGSRIKLMKKELNLLMFLMLHCGEALNRHTIIENVWEEEMGASFTNIVDVYINRLRRKIDHPFQKKLIHTVHGFGYKLCEMDSG